MKSKYPQTFDKAKVLLNTEPLPQDIEKQLDELRKQTPKQFQDMFDMFYEAAIVASPVLPE